MEQAEVHPLLREMRGESATLKDEYRHAVEQFRFQRETGHWFVEPTDRVSRALEAALWLWSSLGDISSEPDFVGEVLSPVAVSLDLNEFEFRTLAFRFLEERENRFKKDDLCEPERGLQSGGATVPWRVIGFDV